VDLEALKPGKWDKGQLSRNERMIFASSGRLENSIKGYDIGIRALAKAKRMANYRNFEYHIAGVGPDEEKLRKLTCNLGLSDQVLFRGWLESPEMFELLKHCHMFIHPAHYDPFPVAVLEAMGAGAVVLGSNASGSVRDRVINGVNGFVHDAGDVEQLSEQIEYLMLHPEIIGTIGACSRKTAEKWPAMEGVSTIKEIFLKQKESVELKGGHSINGK